MKKHLLYIITGLMLLASCSDDLLDVESTSKMEADAVFVKESSIRAMRSGIYGMMAYQGAGALYTLYHPIIGGISGDDMVYGQVWYQTLGAEYAYKVTPTSSGAESLWAQSYYVIEAANSLIENLSDDADLSPDEIKQFRAEGKAIRAMVHVDLARYFGKAYHLTNGESPSIPYMNMIDYEGKPYRNTQKYVYAQAIKDLTDAIPHLPELAGENAKYMNRNAAYAVLARIYMDMHDYVNAKKYAKDAFKGSLMTQDEYFEGGLSRVNSESILAFANDKNKMSKWRTFISFHDNYDGMGDDFVANPEIVNQFSDNDVRKGFFMAETFFNADGNYKGRHASYWDKATVMDNLATLMSWSIAPVGGYYIYGKFPRRDAIAGESRGTLAVGEYNYIRGSEMKLIVAECEARLTDGDKDNARAILEEIGNRMSYDGTKLIDASSLEGQDLLDAILLEKRKELLGEGHDHMEVLRLGKGLVRTGHTHTAPLNLAADDASFIYPIPKFETDVNQNLLEPAQDPTE